MMLLKTKGIIWSYIGLVWPYWKSLELNYFTNIYLNECISIVLLSLLEKRTVNRSFSFRNPKESWISSFVMIVEISTEHRALNHIPFIYLIFLGPCHALFSIFLRPCNLFLNFSLTPFCWKSNSMIWIFAQSCIVLNRAICYQCLLLLYFGIFWK